MKYATYVLYAILVAVTIFGIYSLFIGETQQGVIVLCIPIIVIAVWRLGIWLNRNESIRKK